MLIGAAIGIAVQAIREIVTPHHAPAPFTLVVLVAVVAIKELLFRRIAAVGRSVASEAVLADAWHHRSDAITSAAAFIGISVALLGGPGWEEADDWAALAAAAVISFNAQRLLRTTIGSLMDRAPGRATLAQIEAVASAVPDVRAIEKAIVRRAGIYLFVDLHVHADPLMSLRDAHVLSGKVKRAVMAAIPTVRGVLVHMEPHEERA
jgi:cation diffusion facilitator family transporter